MLVTLLKRITQLDEFDPVVGHGSLDLCSKVRKVGFKELLLYLVRPDVDGTALFFFGDVLLNVVGELRRVEAEGARAVRPGEAVGEDSGAVHVGFRAPYENALLVEVRARIREFLLRQLVQQLGLLHFGVDPYF